MKRGYKLMSLALSTALAMTLFAGCSSTGSESSKNSVGGEDGVFTIAYAPNESTTASAEFSFFLAIPVMVGMSGLKLIQLGGFGAMNATELVSMVIGFVVSFVVALFVVKKFISFLQKKPMTVFAIYRIAFGVFVLILALCGIVSFTAAEA